MRVDRRSVEIEIETKKTQHCCSQQFSQRYDTV